MDTTVRALRTTAGSVLVALSLCACLDNKLADDATQTSSVFIAQRRDFADYSTWMTFEREVPNGHGGVAGTTTVYLNELPSMDARQFPIGTILVKTMQAADSGATNIHAMVKRGAGFNPKGTLGWEFFELALAKKDGQAFWLWRGEKPPSGDQYQVLLGQAQMDPRDAETDCNGCHANAKDGTFGELADLLK
jgi:hypothetical protein